jgi:hypothetical protein
VNGRRLLTAVAAAALMSTPAWALPSHQGTSHIPGSPGSQGNTGATGATGPGNSGSHKPPNAGPPSNARAFGFLCQKESKRHVRGQKGTPFSQCVTAMAKLASGSATNPAAACAKLSKRHTRGQKGTPFSQCVSAAAKLQGRGHPPTGTTGPTGPTGPTGTT